jgi:3-oxoacyl-[acyl-carrier protein] reductase
MVRDSTQTLAGKVAAVSGASSGIGAIIARELAHRGATIIINYPQPGEQKAAECTQRSVISNMPAQISPFEMLMPLPEGCRF